MLGQQCWDMLCRDVAIIWTEFKSTFRETAQGFKVGLQRSEKKKKSGKISMSRGRVSNS